MVTSRPNDKAWRLVTGQGGMASRTALPLGTPPQPNFATRPTVASELRRHDGRPVWGMAECTLVHVAHALLLRRVVARPDTRRVAGLAAADDALDGLRGVLAGVDIAQERVPAYLVNRAADVAATERSRGRGKMGARGRSLSCGRPASLGSGRPCRG